MEDVVRCLERLQQGETEEEEQSRMFAKKKQELWDNQYHKHIASQKGSYEASFILEQTLGPRPETPLLDKIATPEELKGLEEDAQKKDDILEDWHTPPGSPWERSEDATHDTTSLSEDTESDDSLPELVSDDTETEADDSGYVFLNTPPSTGEEDTSTEDEEKEKKKQAMYREIDRRDEEARMKELAMEHILDMEDGNCKPPTTCIGLTYPLIFY